MLAHSSGLVVHRLLCKDRKMRVLCRKEPPSFRPKRPLGTRSGEIYSKTDFPSGLSASLRVSTRLWLARNDVLNCFLQSKLRAKNYNRGFSVIEILIVLVILAIVALVAIPMVSSAAGVQLRSAANMIAADLEYAKSMAIARAQNFSVVFDSSQESYQIEDSTGTVIAHPVKKGFNYVVDLPGEGLDKVDIVNADFDPDSSNTITFNYFGSPYNGNDSPLNSGVITLQTGGVTITIAVEPVTGFISIAN